MSFWPLFGIARPCRVSPGIYKFVLLATIWHRQALQSFCSDIQICPSGHCCLSGHYSASRCPAEFLQGYTNLSFWPLFGLARPCRVSAGIYKFVLLATVWHRQALQFLQVYTNLSFWPLFGIDRPCRVSPGIYKFVLLATIWHRQALQSFSRDIQICPSGHYLASPGPAEFLHGYTNLSFWPLFGIARPCRVSAAIYKFVPLATDVSQATIRHHDVLQSFSRDIQICPSGHYLASPGPAEFLQGYTNLSFWPLFGIARPCRVSAAIYKFVPLATVVSQATIRHHDALQSCSRVIQICPSGHYLASPGPAEFLQRYTNLSFWPLLSLRPIFGITMSCRVSPGVYKFVLLATIWHRQALQSFVSDIQICPSGHCCLSGHYSASRCPAEFLQGYTNLSFWPLFGIARPCRVSPGIYKFVLLATIWHRQALQSFCSDIQICPSGHCCLSGHYSASRCPAEFLQGYSNLSFWPLFGIARPCRVSPGIYKFVLLATIWHRQALQSFCRDIQICPSGQCLASPGPAVSPGIYKFVLLATIWHRQALQSFPRDIQICPSSHCCLSGHYLGSLCPAEFLQGYTNLSFWPLFGIARPCRVSPGIYKFVLLATVWHRQALQSFSRDIQICPSGHYLASPGPAEFLQGYTNLSFWPLFGIARPCSFSRYIQIFPSGHYLASPGPAEFPQGYTNLSL